MIVNVACINFKTSLRVVDSLHKPHHLLKDPLNAWWKAVGIAEHAAQDKPNDEIQGMCDAKRDGLQPKRMASNLLVMASNLLGMASNLLGMASNLL